MAKKTHKKKAHRKHKRGCVEARVSCRVSTAKGKVTLICGGQKPILLKKGKGSILVPVRAKAGKGKKAKAPAAPANELMPFAS